VFKGRVPAEADFVTYWFEKARASIEGETAKRVGLLATQGIRGGASRRILQRVKGSGDIFMAWPDEPWIVEGATVHVSIVGFDDGSEHERFIAGSSVSAINSNLTGGVDLTKAERLPENQGVAFMGDTKGGPFDVDQSVARHLLEQPNPDGRKNEDVVRPWVNSMDVMRRPRSMWIIDIPPHTPLDEAALYEAPFEYLKEHVKTARKSSRSKIRNWWMHERPRPDMRAALAGLSRYIVTPTVSKHRVFTWLTLEVLPDHQLIVIAKDDNYTFGVLHSRVHELWARGMGTQLREVESGFRYTPSTTFETFPFPDAEEDRRSVIAEAAAKLDHLRSQWLNPPGQDCSVLKRRTLTDLYNEPPTWLTHLHQELDSAVLASYGWETDLTDEDILGHLLHLNRTRASAPAAEDARLELG
jgi:type II restriction/modification system DNA methylase subunit YeeA